jgi:diguanylate cyclase (GGDEF)-like protein
MSLRSAKSRAPAKPALPQDVYASLVDALYDVRTSLFIGALASSLAALLTVWKSLDALLLGFALAIAAVACIRALDMSHYVRARAASTPLTMEELKDWELRYVIGAALHVTLLGGWTLAAFVRTDDPFIHLFSFSVTLAYMIGIAGRNFASNSLVSAQIVCAALPLSAALFYAGGFYYAVFGLVILPFFASLRIISRKLRKTLLDAVITARDISKLAVQFDTALNNMPHGLVMFDADQRLVVTNRKFIEFFELHRTDALTGATPTSLVHQWVEAGVVLRSEADRLASALEDRLSGDDRDGFTLQKQDGRTLEFEFEQMAKGGSVAVIEDVTDQRAAEARISHLARYDALTGLANRVYFRERVERVLAAAGGEACAILFTDLDQFKQVNDTLGHPRGDTLLRAVAERLRRLVRETDIVARFGGDEFVILQSPVNNVDDAASLARRVIAALGEPYEIDGHQVVIGATIGIALYPRDAASVDHLLKIADMALYWAKADQRGTWRFFDPEMDVRAHARRALELDIRHALSTNAFEVYYQPLFDIRTKQISTCEALLRWPHPTRGMIPPSEFIPVAEEMGLIVELGSWVLREACRACAAWPNDVRVAVNLSTHQFRRGDLFETIREAVESVGLEPHRLELEITETVLFQDTRAMRQILRRFNDYGVRISLDDFGTGYSSLSYLHSLPLHKVKIDRSFLEGLESGARPLVLLRGITKLSADLGLDVVVEGVETAEQLAIIAAEDGVTEAQGFLFSPAVPEREIRAMLMAQPSRMELVA